MDNLGIIHTRLMPSSRYLGRAALVVAQGKALKPRRAFGRRYHVHDPVDHLAIGEHAAIIVAPLP